MINLPIVLEYVAAEQVSSQDLALVQEADAASPAIHKLQPTDVLEAIYEGEFQLFRVRYAGGVILTQIWKGADERKRLNIIRCTSNARMGWLMRKIAQLLQHTAQEWGCEAVESMVYSPRLARALLRVGAKAESVRVVLEVK